MERKHPKGIWNLFMVEMWERFGFYIMSAIYVLYMEKDLHFDDAKKGVLYGSFLFASYAFPLLGGWLGDWAERCGWWTRPPPYLLQTWCVPRPRANGQ